MCRLEAAILNRVWAVEEFHQFFTSLSDFSLVSESRWEFKAVASAGFDGVDFAAAAGFIAALFLTPFGTHGCWTEGLVIMCSVVTGVIFLMSYDLHLLLCGLQETASLHGLPVEICFGAVAAAGSVNSLWRYCCRGGFQLAVRECCLRLKPASDISTGAGLDNFSAEHQLVLKAGGPPVFVEGLLSGCSDPAQGACITGPWRRAGVLEAGADNELRKFRSVVESVNAILGGSNFHGFRD